VGLLLRPLVPDGVLTCLLNRRKIEPNSGPPTVTTALVTLVLGPALVDEPHPATAKPRMASKARAESRFIACTYSSPQGFIPEHWPRRALAVGRPLRGGGSAIS
jgi:hypothetical protein